LVAAEREAFGRDMKLNLLSIDEVAAKLGVSRQMVMRYLDRGRIPFVELGGRRFVEARHAKKPKANKPGPKPEL
jgi:excisionase family DNA binding protein